MDNTDKSPVDNPIKSSDEDLVGRADVAHSFARDLRELDLSEGAVVAVMGQWGSGKSSFVNMMKEDFRADPELTVIDFNPWMFSGAQQLVDVFFKEIASELRLASTTKFGDIAEALDEYGDILSPIAILPIVGAWWERTQKSYKAARKWWKQRGAQPVRKRVADKLADLELPVVVVVDDIDRLSTDEIRDIFKLVRLTASFPNVIYVLAFDRLRVEAALDETNVPGRAYLEKIIQLSFDLPAIPGEVLRSQVFEELNHVLDGVEDLRFSATIWPDIFYEIVEPLVGNMRDVTRLALSARTPIRALGSDVETVDLVALEAVRVFRPEIFSRMQTMRTTLTEIADVYGRRDTSRQKGEIDALLEVAASDAELVRNLIRRVFPAARQYVDNHNYSHEFSDIWRREHRVAHIDFLNLYLDRVAPSELVAFKQAEHAHTLLTDAEALSAYFSGLNPDELEHTVKGLEVYADSYPIESVVPASIALLNLIPSFPERAPRGMFDISRPDIVVGRVVLRLFRRLEAEVDRESAVAEILPRLRSYSTQYELVQSVGYQEGVGHKLVSEEFATQIEDVFFERVATLPSPSQSEEWDLLRVYWSLRDRQGDDYHPQTLTNVDEVRSLFTSARSFAQSQSFDSRNVRQEERLWWDGLVAILGDEVALREARDLLSASDGETPLVALIDKYLDGWRPARD